MEGVERRQVRGGVGGPFVLYQSLKRGIKILSRKISVKKYLVGNFLGGSRHPHKLPRLEHISDQQQEVREKLSEELQGPLVLWLSVDHLVKLAAGGTHDLNKKSGQGCLRLERGPSLGDETAGHDIDSATRRRLHGGVQKRVAVHGADLQTDVLQPAKDALLGALGGQDGQRHDHKAEPPLHLVEVRQVHARRQ